MNHKISLLLTNPMMYPHFDLVKSLENDYRCFVVGNYVVVYHVDIESRIITMHRILYGKRNLKYINFIM